MSKNYLLRSFYLVSLNLYCIREKLREVAAAGDNLYRKFSNRIVQ